MPGRRPCRSTESPSVAETPFPRSRSSSPTSGTVVRVRRTDVDGPGAKVVFRPPLSAACPENSPSRRGSRSERLHTKRRRGLGSGRGLLRPVRGEVRRPARRTWETAPSAAAPGRVARGIPRVRQSPRKPAKLIALESVEVEPISTPRAGYGGSSRLREPVRPTGCAAPGRLARRESV